MGATYMDKRSYVLRGKREVTLHSVIPGMIVAFHHYETRNGVSTRTKIDVSRVVFERGHLAFERLPESYGMVEMPTRGDE